MICTVFKSTHEVAVFRYRLFQYSIFPYKAHITSIVVISSGAILDLVANATVKSTGIVSQLLLVSIPHWMGDAAQWCNPFCQNCFTQNRIVFVTNGQQRNVSNHTWFIQSSSHEENSCISELSIAHVFLAQHGTICVAWISMPWMFVCVSQVVRYSMAILREPSIN